MMDIRIGYPFRGKAMKELRGFLVQNGLTYDERITYSLCLIEDDEIVATGSLDGGILKCIAVSRDVQEGGLAARIVSGLIDEAARNGIFHLFLFTKPENEALFGSLGFYTITKTNDVLLMENKRNGVAAFVAALEKPEAVTGVDMGMVTGAIVMNCNPFTLGHRYLAERAAAECGHLHIFVVSEEKSVFPAEVRLRLARAGTAHIKNVLVHPSGSYLISAATFPDYFIKDSVQAERINALLDITIFAECFARPLGITRRFVGEEPLDPVTRAYNQQMKEALPFWGIKVWELRRLEQEGVPVSASRVRELLAQGRLEEAGALVPHTTREYLWKRYGGGI
ncbi:MAG: [citrate (pro-3S)-lyase] ligase [Treponema sp.]|jgi:[citrate (pro-3S)-lyase] ligase|nr:[citrate (pro-3S)-lyase] ligase [Treponema sp.]